VDIDSLVGRGPSAITRDADGHIYTAGNVDGQRWYVRRSDDGGRSWADVDDVQLAGGKTTNACAITTVGAGTTLVAGDGYDAGDARFGLLRRSDDHGSTWTTDLFPSADS
jgi:hypothetical protein